MALSPVIIPPPCEVPYTPARKLRYGKGGDQSPLCCVSAECTLAEAATADRNLSLGKGSFASLSEINSVYQYQPLFTQHIVSPRLLFSNTSQCT